MSEPSLSYQAERNLGLEAVRVTEAAALAAAKWIGRGDEKSSDQAAVDAMRTALNALRIRGTVVIGEGERDEAPMLYIGEEVGTREGPDVDIALDPLEGTTITAIGAPNAIACMAMAPKGGFLNAPDTYMDKLAIGAGLPDDVLDLNQPASVNLKRIAEAKGVPVTELIVLILDRPRHEALINEVRELGARIRLIGDGDVAGVIATARANSGIDVYIGAGGAPEGVLAAAALRAIGGQMQGRLRWRNDREIERAKRMGIEDPHRIYNLQDLASGDVMFAATGVTDGTMLQGVRRITGGYTTESIVMRSKTGTVRTIIAEHYLLRKQQAAPHFAVS